MTHGPLRLIIIIAGSEILLLGAVFFERRLLKR